MARRKDHPADWSTRMATVHREAEGMLQVEIIRPVDAPGLMAAARAGDSDALRLLNLVPGTCTHIETAPAESPATCLTCERLLAGRTDYSVLIAIPAGSRDPSMVVGCGICPVCATKPADLIRCAEIGMQRIYPGCRHLVVHPDGGRA